MVLRTSHIMLPSSNARMKTLTRSFNGAGYGTVLLDGGMGGQSTYHGIDDYIETTSSRNSRLVNGNGLSDRISSKLSKLNISSPKMKNITLSL